MEKEVSIAEIISVKFKEKRIESSSLAIHKIINTTKSLKKVKQKESMKSILSKYSSFSDHIDENKEMQSKTSSKEAVSDLASQSAKTSSSSSDKHFINDVFFSMNEQYNQAFNNFFIDSIYNTNEYYEIYLINNMKIIKTLQFFIMQDDYDSQFQNISKKFWSNFQLDYNSAYLFIDLDETLIHSEPFKEENRDSYTVVVNIPIDNIPCQDSKYEALGVYMRPNCIEFLSFCKQNFKLILFTAAELNYAKPICEACGFLSFFDIILDRSYTIKLKEFQVKDLSLFSSQSQKLNCLLIDNNIFSLTSCLSQGILISSFFNSTEDTELIDLMSYFESVIADIVNMVQINSNYYMYEELMRKIDINKLD